MQEQMWTGALKEGQKVLLRDHTVMVRNKIHPKIAEDVWVIVEVLGEESRATMLHSSNIRPRIF